MNLSDFPHKRYNPLSDEWILVSPHRTRRPWQGKVEKIAENNIPEYDNACYLCPGNVRAGSARNPLYDGTYIFVNDFSALLGDIPDESMNEKDLLVAGSEKGICKVICFSPKHNLTFALMSPEQIIPVVDVWAQQYSELGAIEHIKYVQIFENRGSIMGCSNMHPHGQIWANETIPDVPARETAQQEKWIREKGKCLLCSYAELERNMQARVVVENDSFLAVVPFWAIWPFEVLALPKRHMEDITQMSGKEKSDCADIMHRISVKYDNLFETSFPYSMGIHQKPTDKGSHEEWHFHIHYFPPLLRSATVRKFMVGYELLAMPQRDITPEDSARRLRECSEVHYSLR
jgi:UDPglucose--hexose-1-phosphate uridylyltransferase